MPSSSTSAPLLSPLLDSEAALLLSASDSFFSTSSRGGGAAGLLRDHKLPPAQLLYWLGYGNTALDWDALIAYLGMELEGEKPRRVLDLGCGITAGWCLSMLREKGWEGTQFVGLDVAQVLVPMSMLPYDQSSRLSFVQHNFLQRLPFEDAKFDFVRMGNLGMDVPEPRFQDLVDEIVRVLVPGGILAFTTSDLPSIPAPPALALTLEAFFDTSFINTSPSTLIPFLLSIHTQRTLSSQIHRFSLPLSPPSSLHQPTTPVPIPKRHTRLLIPPSAPPHASRILLHAHALRLESFIPALLHSSSFTPDTRLTRSLVETPGISPLRKELQQRREVEEAITEWREELVERAGIAILIESWGWNCAMDQRLEEVLQDAIPALEEGLRGVEEEQDGEGERRFARAQKMLSRREAEVDLRAVRKRLGRGVWEEGVLGELVVGEWVAVVPLT